jgi:DNA replication and repair protein RecF
MICRYALYSNFRNIEAQRISFSEGINIIYGNNAQGKTNAIEGIYLCAQGRSHRTVHEKEYISFGKSDAFVEIGYEDKRRSNKIKLFFNEKGKKYCEKNGYSVKRMSEIVGDFRAVIFTPEHLSIVKEGPQKRRAFLDSAISQIDKAYLEALQRYNKILAQRNKLLAEGHRGEEISDTLSVWSEKMAEEASLISYKRSEYTERVDKVVKDIFSDMTGGREKISFVYKKAREKSDFLKMLTENTDREIRMGTTLFGVHKDDIDIDLNGADARSFASQGQQRSISLAMKLAEGEISKNESGDYPVFLFDDVLSELDNKRKEYLLGGLSGKQVIITTCEEQEKKEGINLIYAENGVYRQI